LFVKSWSVITHVNQSVSNPLAKTHEGMTLNTESCKTGHGDRGSVVSLTDIHHLGLVVEAQPRYIVCQQFVNRPSVKKEEETDG